MEISAVSFLDLLGDISKAVSRKESGRDYDDLLRKFFEEREPYDHAPADSEIGSKQVVQTFPSGEVFGRDEEMEMLLSKLFNPGIKLSVIPILGGCGMGKTTLARLVFEDESVKEHFELRVWVRVDGQEFNLQNAARGILKSTIGMSCSVDDLDELDEMVRDTLQSQRCLIVFDGIESMAKDSWLHMNKYWFDFLDLGSKVLITTPSEDVANLVANQSVKLAQLSEDDGWFLCRYLAFHSSVGIKYISSPMAENLAALCSGIPLLLQLVGSLMRYDDKLRSLLLSVDFSDMISLPPSDASVAILLCVWALPPYLRKCLANLAVFPKGCALNKEKIIAMWMADVLVKPSPQNNCLEDISNSYFLQLLCRSFFSDITCHENGDITGFRISGMVHETLLDLARIFWNGKLGMIGFIGANAAQLSLVKLPFTEKCNPKHLQTLILSPKLYLGTGSLDHSLLEFKGLQSLDLSCSGIQDLSEDICALKELKYLNLSYTLIQKVPDSITYLSCLQTLDLSWCYHLNDLPKEMCKLTHIRHLDLSCCESLSYLPSGISFLESLTSMPLFVLGKDPGCAQLGELGLLNKLSGRLEIINLENVREISEARDARLDQKNLYHLGLSWSQNADDCFKLLELLQPNRQLKVLDLTGYMGFEFPRWISSVNSLIKISITNCGCKVLPSLGKLPFLKELQLKGMKNIEFIGREFYGQGILDIFPSLEQLGLYDMPRLSEWSDTSDIHKVGVFLRLETLTIEGCPQLPSLPSLPTLANLIVWNSNKSILSFLTSFRSLSSLLINDVELGTSFMDFGRLGSLKKLILCNIMDNNINNVLHMPGKVFTALEHLGILHCHELIHLDLYKFFSLEKLHIVDCPNLVGVLVREEENTPLMEVVVEDCPQAISFVLFHKFRSLRKLIVKNCSQFTIYYADQYKKLEKLEYLSISGCQGIERELETFPSLVCHVPCIIVGDHKANFKDRKDLRKVPISATHESAEVMVPSHHRLKHGPEMSITKQPIHDLVALKYKEIKKATRKFRPDMLLGKGSFSTVFKGWIDEHTLTAVKPGFGIAVAVKKLEKEGSRGHTLWSNEIKYLSQLCHPNLVKLIGYCSGEGNMILVYEFMPGGSLYNHLFTGGHQLLSWATRIKVAIGAARGLSFLHDLEMPVIHRDVKSSAILLDSEFNAKLSTFGVARDGPTVDRTHVSTQIMGTIGYIAPEYVATGRLTTSCDVYGFGVVLLELLSGRRVVDFARPEEEDRNLVEWARLQFGDKRELWRIMDSRLEGKYPHNAADMVATLAMQCLSLNPKERPRTADVVVALEQLQCPKIM